MVAVRFVALFGDGNPALPKPEGFRVKASEGGLLLSDSTSTRRHITTAVKYRTVVIPAEAGIQKDTGCRIQSGMTELAT